MNLDPKINKIYTSIPLKINNTSLIQGRCLYILLSFEFYRHSKNSIYKMQAYEHLDKLINDRLKSYNCTLGYGSCGVLYTIASLARNNFIDVEKVFFEPYYIELDLFVESASKSGNYDLLQGLIGVGLFYIELGKLEKKLNSKVYQIIQKLLLLSTEYDKMIYWKYKLENFPNKYDGIVNLGILHGMPSVLLFLMICYKEGYRSEHLASEIRKGINFIIMSQKPNKEGFSYNHYLGIVDGKFAEEKMVNSFAYCRGDLGIILLFQKAAEIFQDSFYKMYSKELFIPIQDQLVNLLPDCNNPYFCHGTAGILTLTNSFETLFSDKDKYKKAIEILTNRLIDSFNIDKSNCSLLDGSCGVLFALLKQKLPNVRSIDRILLLD